jgi:hypothetical protein
LINTIPYHIIYYIPIKWAISAHIKTIFFQNLMQDIMQNRGVILPLEKIEEFIGC